MAPKKIKKKDEPIKIKLTEEQRRKFKVTRTWRKYFQSKIRHQKTYICWAIGGSALLEAKYNRSCISDDDWEELSPQFLVNKLCGPGDLAMRKFKPVNEFLQTTGICTEEHCKYLGILPNDYQQCQPQPPFFIIDADPIEKEGKISDDYIEGLFSQGPVLGIFAAYQSFGALQEGEIWTGPKRGDKHLGADHAVVITDIGSKTEDNGEVTHFWSVRNSAGTNWADKGYGLVHRRPGQPSLFTQVWCPEIVRMRP
ncbi:uncharacterized protein LOC126660161 [Mercurialis annua]|uniref:uncharacterized protein LOC126660161 n=1 Tax=Mercurialis annua TaxID=3986 RepID=UPI00215E5A2D|nr:uncharacterized protein LOC126660161 [Mercurialis annua]